jgi:hypothetical protein
MTQLTQTRPRSPALALAGVAIAASMLGGIVGGVVGTRVQALVESAAIQRAQVVAAHDQAVLESAQEWEARQRQMYPAITAHDVAVLKSAQEWEARQRQMYPAITAHDVAVLKSAQEWEARQRQMYPIQVYPISTTAGAPDVLRAAQDRAEEYRQAHPGVK